MSSKKLHHDPRYHKLRDMGRQSVSVKGSVRKEVRQTRVRAHRCIRRSVHMKLHEATKTYTANGQDFDDCEPDFTPDLLDPTLWEIKWWVNLRGFRHGRDALNPCINWERKIRANSGNMKLHRRFRGKNNVSISHLKFHVHFGMEPYQKFASRTRQALAREFKARGLTPTSNPREQLAQIAKLASANKTETVLTRWTGRLADDFLCEEGRIWRSKDGFVCNEWLDDLYWWFIPQAPYRRPTNKSFAISDSWRVWGWGDDTPCVHVHFRQRKGSESGVYFNHGFTSGWWDSDRRFSKNETSVRQLGRAKNKFEFFYTDPHRKRTSKVTITNKVNQNTTFRCTIDSSNDLFVKTYHLSVRRPLNGAEDADAWASEIYQFLRFFHDSDLFKSAHWRWIVYELLAAITPNTTR